MINSVINFLTTTLYIGGLGLILILGLLYFFQNKILYLPEVQGLAKSPANNPVGYRNPGDMGISYKTVEIKTEDGIVIRGWLCLNQDSQNIPTIVYFHENAGNIGTRVFYLKEYMTRIKANVLLMAYRGYSDSDGTPTEVGLQLDAKATLNYLQTENAIDQRKIFIHGRSLGGAVAIYIAHELRPKIAGLILEITFTSLSDMVDVIFPKLAIFKKILMKNHWRSIDRIGEIKLPMLFIYAMKDELVPPAQMTKLYESAISSPLKMKHIVENGNHNNNWQLDAEAYFKSVQNFINQALSSKIQLDTPNQQCYGANNEQCQ